MAKLQHYAAALITLEGQVLLGKRSLTRKKYPGWWDILGGHREKGETYEQAMLREVKEETGLDATAYTLLRIVDRTPEFVMAVYHITGWLGVVTNGEPSEHERLEWISFRDALQLNFPESLYAELLTELRHP